MDFMAGESIIIVEDEGISALEIQDNLEYWGYKVVSVVDNGPDAIQESFKLKPDLILMDITLKGDMDGVDAATVIKTFLDVPLIFLTALDDVEIFKRISDTRATAYLVKPIEEAELRNNVELALQTHRSHQKDILDQQKESLEDVQVFMRSALPEFANNIPLADRNAFLKKFMKGFEQNMKPQFHKFFKQGNQEAFEKLSDDEKLKRYLSWVSKLYNNLGFKVQPRVHGNKGVLTVRKCSWSPLRPQDVFLCMICQSVMNLTYSWTGLPGTVKAHPTSGMLKSVCQFDYEMEEND